MGGLSWKWIAYVGVNWLLFPGYSEYLNDLPNEVIGITVIIKDNANNAIKCWEEEKQLILQKGDLENAFTIVARRQHREKGWLKDGSSWQPTDEVQEKNS